MKKIKEVMITLKSIQYNGEEKFETELITEGKYKKTVDGYMISYNETEATGFKDSKTSLTTLGDFQVTMTRKGPASSNLVIEKVKAPGALHLPA